MFYFHPLPLERGAAPPLHGVDRCGSIWRTLRAGPCRAYPVAVIVGLLVLVACQLVGGFLARLFDLPVPGAVIGMVLLLAWLQLRRPGPDSGVVRVSEGLLRHLQLFFVPAGVGVVQYAGVLAASAVPLVVGLVASWLVTLLVTAATVALLIASSRRLRAEP